MRPTILSLARMASRGKRAPPPLPPTPAIASSSTLPSSTISDSVASGSSSTLRQEGWYHVNRSDGGKLPVYSKIRNGGAVTTIIRKVDGDVRTLQTQLTSYLSDLHIDPFTHSPKVTVRPTNNHLQIKGHWVDEVKGWLEGRGF
ncbi:hypothetical protein I302_102294 [Kwoniella bestiolae CBS 10118]|uniref:Large ribosomal subunit protein mL49 n=1 Tax=Kwoniella bestiolae CBS 10118 TaxID=1296100 RepID=A0A1B9GEN4_9TREE|nr:hypothetical protein I302_00986 [Kwoniella bestiolae CBS 10118]OCF29480.1 hypothetical protein I302_00986 [Kwoniella bestiolae CBS 10118]